MVDSRRRWAQLAHRVDSEWKLEDPIEGGVLCLHSLELAIELDPLYRRAGVEE